MPHPCQSCPSCTFAIAAAVVDVTAAVTIDVDVAAVDLDVAALDVVAIDVVAVAVVAAVVVDVAVAGVLTRRQVSPPLRIKLQGAIPPPGVTVHDVRADHNRHACKQWPHL